MFGNTRELMIRRALPNGVGTVLPGLIGGYGGGTFNTDGTQATPVAPQEQQPHRKTAQRVAGYLADALAGLAGQQGPYAAQLALEEQRRYAENAYQRRQADEYSGWQRKQEYEAAHPAPVNNDTINDFNWYKNLSEPDRAIYDQMHPVYRIGPDGLPYPMARGQGAPTAPVGRLTPIDGGPASQAPGGFR